MLRAIVVSLLIVVGVFVSGCQTMTQDEEQQIRRYSRIADVNRRLFAEDMNTIFLLNEPSHLTDWHFYVD